MQFLFILKDFSKMQDNAILPRFSTHLSNAKVGPGGFGLRQLTRLDGINGTVGILSHLFLVDILNQGLHMKIVYGLNQRGQITPTK